MRSQTRELKILLTNAKEGSIYRSSSILTSFVPFAVAYDGAYNVYFATSFEERNCVYQVKKSAAGVPSERLMFCDVNDGAGNNAVLASQGGVMDDIHYASNTGTFFMLCSACGFIVEVRPLRRAVSSTRLIPAAPEHTRARTHARFFAHSHTPRWFSVLYFRGQTDVPPTIDSSTVSWRVVCDLIRSLSRG